jgi:hypothetical protein
MKEPCPSCGSEKVIYSAGVTLAGSRFFHYTGECPRCGPVYWHYEPPLPLSWNGKREICPDGCIGRTETHVGKV